MIEQLFAVSPGVDVSIVTVVGAIIVAFVLSLFISWVYKKTHRGLSYSPSFVSSLVIMGPTLAVIMMIVGTSLARAFTVFGAFTLIRFRTAIKDTRDIAFVLWILLVGLASGTGNHTIALTAALLIASIVWFVYVFRVGVVRVFDYVVTIRQPLSTDANFMYREIFDRHVKDSNLLSTTSNQQSGTLEMSFQVSLKDRDALNAFSRELNALDEINEVVINRTQGDLEF